MLIPKAANKALRVKNSVFEIIFNLSLLPICISTD